MTDGLPRSISAVYRVRFDEARPDGSVRGSALLGYVQDVAWVHSEALGFTREWYAERGLGWLVRAVEVTVLGRIAHGSALEISTRIVGYRRVLARRQSPIRDETGALVAMALTDWVLTDRLGAPTRIPDDFVRVFGAEPGYEPLRVPRAEPPADAATTAFAVRDRDLDPVGHTNNGVYLDLLDESIAALPGGDAAIVAVPRRYDLEYVAPATRGDGLVGLAWRDGDRWLHRLDRAADGATLLRGVLGPGDPGG
jgi:acyl-CoA thioester hydrolase